MSGKSTYLRQVILLCIMGQVGSYVPAEQATFRQCVQIQTHIDAEPELTVVLDPPNYSERVQ